MRRPATGRALQPTASPMNVLRFADLCARGAVRGQRVFIRADFNIPLSAPVPASADADPADLEAGGWADPARITEEMERRGLVRVREEEWQGRPSKQKFMLGQVLVDVFYVHPRGDGFVDHNLFSRHSVLRGTHLAMAIETRRLGGLDLPVPADTEAYLHHLYGDGWRQPVKAWTWYFSGNNIELLMDWRDLPWLLVQWFKWQQRLRAR